MIRFCTFVCLYALCCFNSFAQDHNARELADRIQSTNTIPENLLSGKSILLIIAPDQGDWQEIAREAQPYMKKSGIDAVAAYNFNDLLSGVEAFNAFRQRFADRGIDILVIISKDSGEYKLQITPFNPSQFIAPDQPGWVTNNAELDRALRNAYLAAANSGQKLSNFLILEQPEYGGMVHFITGRRAEFYDLNFSSEKLAVLPFADTIEINEVMKGYPYEYGFVDPAKEEKDLRAEGYQFILYYVHASGSAVKDILGYEINMAENSYVTETIMDGKPTMKTFDKDRSVYKFYIKHIYSGNTFLGKKWDAAPRWQDALTYYLGNLRDELISN